MAIVPDRYHNGTGGLAGIFPTGGPLGGIGQQRHIYGYGLGGNPFYNAVNWHQSRAFQMQQRQGRPVVGPPRRRPPYWGGNPPHPTPGYPSQPYQPPPPYRDGNPPHTTPAYQVAPIYYNPLGAQMVHPALIASRLGLYG
jgi:hypothetical protein